jgi:hypothetical protein
MALVSTFKPKYNVPELWINPLNGGNFFMYTKNYNKYTKVSISPTALPETIITSRHTYYNFIHIRDFLINYRETIFQLFYMWILDLQDHIQHLEQVIYKINNK